MGIDRMLLILYDNFMCDYYYPFVCYLALVNFQILFQHSWMLHCMVLETKCLSFGFEPPLFPQLLLHISMLSQLWNVPECP